MAKSKSAKKKPEISKKVPAGKPVSKPAAKAAPAKKAAPKPAAKVVAKPAAKPAVAKKPAPKPAPKTLPAKSAAKGKPSPVVAAKGKAVAPTAKGKPAPAVVAKGKPAAPSAKGKPAAPSAKGKPAAATAKGGKSAAARAAHISHEEQRRLLDSHRQGHQQQSPVEAAPVKPKLQVFTLDEVRAYLKTRRGNKMNLWIPDEDRKARERTATAGKGGAANKPNSVGAASLSSLFGFNPFKKANPADEAARIPEKWRRYHKLLLEARSKLETSVARHTDEALKKSGKDDAGDLSGYSQHLADAGTDTADRDFALNLIASEQQQIKEIDDAIERMRQGAYGTCEITGRPIPPSRLASVPQTRYSIEGQKDLERQRRAQRRRGGNPLGAEGDEVGFGTGGGGDEGGGDDS